MKFELVTCSSLCYPTSPRVTSVGILRLSIISSHFGRWKAFLKRISNLKYSWWLKFLSLLGKPASKERIHRAALWFVLRLCYLTQVDAIRILIVSVHQSVFLFTDILLFLSTSSLNAEPLGIHCTNRWLLVGRALRHRLIDLVFQVFRLELLGLNVKLYALLRIVLLIVIFIVQRSTVILFYRCCHCTSDCIKLRNKAVWIAARRLVHTSMLIILKLSVSRFRAYINRRGTIVRYFWLSGVEVFTATRALHY